MTVTSPKRSVSAKRLNWFFSNAYLMLSLAPLFWAGNFIMGRWVAGDVPPFALGGMRWVVASLVLLPFAWPHLKRDWPVVRQHLPIVVFLGLTGPTLFNTISYVGLNYTGALSGLIMQSAAPILIVITSFVCFGDRFTSRQGVGILISLVGVLAIITKGDPSALVRFAFNFGDLLILAGFGSWAVYTVFLRKRPDIHWLTFAFLLAASAVALNAPAWIVEHVSGNPLQWNFKAVLGLLYAGIFPSIISYNLYNRGVEMIGSNRAGVFLHLVPLFGSVMAIGWLGEALRAYHIFGFLLIIAGVALAARRG